MSSKKSSGKASLGATGGGPGNEGSKGFGSGKVESQVDRVSENFSNLTVGSADDGEWEVYGKKSKNRSSNAARGTGPAPRASGYQELQQQTNANYNWKSKSSGSNWQSRGVDPRRRGQPNSKPGQSSGRGRDSADVTPAPVIGPPLQSGWQWGAKAGSSSSSNVWPSEDTSKGDPLKSKNTSWGAAGEDSEPDINDEDDLSDDEELVDDDDLLDEDYDSDESQKSFDSRKKNKWFKVFFEDLDNLTVEELSEPTRQWHCPACLGGPGAIDWYKGLQPLVTHAKTKGSKRIKLHRELAELLEEELHRRGSSVVPAGESFGKWKGLSNTITDHEVVWPPMVVIKNTILEKDENDKWTGMGNQELLQYFDSYDAVKARHSYGPQGHRGLSLLIFEASAIGYSEAERLHRHFIEQRTDRDAWEHHRVLFYPGGGGKRQLYGYLATKEDLDSFNQHSHGKAKLKFEMRSYQEMVVAPMRQMSEDNQQLIWLKNKVAKEQRHSRALEQTMGVMSSQLRLANEERNIVKQRVKMQNEENQEEMDYMDKLFKEKIAVIYEAIDEKERALEKSFQDERRKAEFYTDPLENIEDRKHRQDEITRLIDSHKKGVTEFEAEREKLITNHSKKMAELKRRHYEEQVQLEKEFGDAMAQLMEKYQPHS